MAIANCLPRRAVVDALEGRRLFAKPTEWVSDIDNPFMPLKPGMAWNYKGVTDGEPARNRIVVLSGTKRIAGVSCTVVLDPVYVNGQLIERTHDWYAQDKAGNVWYFGESTSEYEGGNVVSREGSWKAGRRGAKPGIVMEADPQVGDAYEQEQAAPDALDEARVLSTDAGVKTPFGRFSGCLQTQETTPLEPGVAESKWYAEGIGFVRSQTTAGSEDEVLALVSFTP